MRLSGWLSRSVKAGTMSDTSRAVLRPYPGITPEQASDIRAACWAYVFRCYESRKNPAAGPSERGEHDGTTKEDSANVSIVPK